MTKSESRASVGVIQSDREAAARLMPVNTIAECEVVADVKSGRYDIHYLVQAFAAYRVQIERGVQEAHARGMDEGATYVLDDLSRQLGIADYQQADGSEEWEGDVSGTVHNILIAASVVDDETGCIAQLGDSAFQSTSAHVPEGYAVVPVEPTEAEISAGVDYALNGVRPIGFDVKDYVRGLRAAMLSAAPIQSAGER